MQLLSDFDIDSLFSRMYGLYDNDNKAYGDYLKAKDPIAQALVEYNEYKKSKDKKEVLDTQKDEETLPKKEKKGFFGFGGKTKDKEESVGNIPDSVIQTNKVTPDSTVVTTPDNQKEIIETEPTETDTNTDPDRVPVSLSDLSLIVGDAEFIAFQEYKAGDDLMEQTMAWLRQTRQFSEVGVNQVVQYADPIERGIKIEEKIQEGDRLLEGAKFLKIALSKEVNFWTQKNNQDTETSKKLNTEYKSILQKIEVTNLNPKLQELTQARRQIAESQTYLGAYSSLLKNVGNFERLLRSKVIPVYRPNTSTQNSTGQ